MSSEASTSAFPASLGAQTGASSSEGGEGPDRGMKLKRSRMSQACRRCKQVSGTAENRGLFPFLEGECSTHEIGGDFVWLQRRAKCDGGVPVCGECARSGAACDRPAAEDDGRKRRKAKQPKQQEKIQGSIPLVPVVIESSPATAISSPAASVSAQASHPDSVPAQLSLDQLFLYPAINPISHLVTNSIPALRRSTSHPSTQHPVALPDPPFNLIRRPTPPQISSFDLFTSLDAAEAVASLQTASLAPPPQNLSSQSHPSLIDSASFETSTSTAPNDHAPMDPPPRLHYLRYSNLTRLCPLLSVLLARSFRLCLFLVAARSVQLVSNPASNKSTF